jgi:hypothetical protein
MRDLVNSLRTAADQARADACVPRGDADRLWAQHNEVNQQFRKLCRKLKKAEDLRENAELQSESWSNARFWSMLKRRRGLCLSATSILSVYDEQGDLQSGKQAADVWRRQYERIGNAVDDGEERIQQSNPFDGDFRATVQREVAARLQTLLLQPALDGLFTLEELNASMAALKLNVAAGPDCLPNRMLKLMGKTAREALLSLFNRIWTSGKWPERWQEGIIIPLFKGGSGSSRADVNDYRPITLTNSIAKLFEMMLLRRLTGWSDEMRVLAEEQGGFRKRRSTLEQIFTLQEVISRRREQGYHTYFAFLDCRVAQGKPGKS